MNTNEPIEEFGPDHVRLEFMIRKATLIRDIQEYLKLFVHEQKKKAKEIKAKAAKIVVKDIRFGPHTDDHDFNFKKNHAIKFLQEGCKVKAFVFFRGREIVFKVQGEILLLRFANELEEWGKAEQLPVLEGKKMLMLIGPRKK